MTLNNYGHTTKRYWEKWLPARFRSLEDPEEFFEDLGNQIAVQVDATSISIAGTDPVDEDYLAKVSRLTVAKKQAEEIVLAELLYSNAPELEPGSEEDRAEWYANQPPEGARFRAELEVEELREIGWSEEDIADMLERATIKPYPGDVPTR